METRSAINIRKSVRSYTGKKVSREDLHEILLAAHASPVGMDKYDNMHLTLIENKDILDAIDAAGAKFFGDPNMHPLYGAPTLIIISTKGSNGKPGPVEYANAAIMVQNMIIAATSLKVGCCHIWGAINAMNQDADVLGRLELPEGFTACGGIILGKTDDDYHMRKIATNRMAVRYFK